MLNKPSYHHGDLADALIKAAVSVLSEKGPEAMSLREVARIAGVSHSAPAHHFGDKAGLLTGVAIAGYKQLAEKLIAHRDAAGSSVKSQLIATGYAYITFAMENPAYFNIMFRPRLLNRDSENYQAASDAAHAVLGGCVQALADEAASKSRVVTAAEIKSTTFLLWSQVHGFSHLWLAGNMGDPNDRSQFEVLFKQMFESISPKWYL